MLAELKEYTKELKKSAKKAFISFLACAIATALTLRLYETQKDFISAFFAVAFYSLTFIFAAMAWLFKCVYRDLKNILDGGLNGL